MKRPKIGISTGILPEKDPKLIQVDRVYVNREYVTVIENTGGIPILLPVTTVPENVAAYVSLCDGFLFSGGIDINPLHYGREPHPGLGCVNADVDLFQIALMKMVLESRKPFLCICRGIQLLNVVCGGDLYQDLCEIKGDILQHEQHAPKYNVIHKVHFKPGSSLYEMFGEAVYTNSYHHQSVKRIGENLEVTGETVDGVVEGLELKNHPFGIGVQWHPEMMDGHSKEMDVLFKSFIESARDNGIVA